MGGLVATVADGWCRRRGCLSYVKFRWDVVQDGWEEGVCVLRVRPALETFFMSRVCLKWKKVRDVRRRLKRIRRREKEEDLFLMIYRRHTRSQGKE